MRNFIFCEDFSEELKTAE